MDILRAEIWNTIQEYLTDDFETPGELEKSLKRLKNDHPEYYDQVVELIRNQEPATQFFSQLSHEIVEAVQEEHFEKGYRIGSYTIEKLLAAGSMSDVYLAIRSDGEFEQEVAIKVLKENIDNPWMKDQFQREKQILASLHHPNIAGIYDGGITPEGRPYIIMEYIDGEAVTSYCDRHGLSINERLQLFRHICRAVNYAHQNLVIHKDLKPNNILVDQNGYVKLMDFGIAQLTEERRKENRPVHAFTPRYASPEQLKRQTLTTASDIYQLGLLLNRILTGFHFQQIAGTDGAHELNLPEESEPGTENQKILKQRGLRTFAQLKKKLQGDPKAIILKALQPQPEDRYPSAEAMHHDLENFFSNMPIHAREKTYSYLLHKFVRRNRRLLQLAFFFIALVATLTTAYFLRLDKARKEAETNAQQARMEARQAENMTNYLKNIFSLADPYVNPNREVPVDKMLHDSYNELLQSEGMDSTTRADMLGIMADVFRNRGDYEKNLDAVQRSAAIKKELYPPYHPEVGNSYRQIAETFLLTKNIDSSAIYIRQALEIDSLNNMLSSNAHLKNLEVQGDVFYYQTNYAAALKNFLLVYQKSMEKKSTGNERLAELLSYIGDTYHQLGRYDSAKIYLRKAIGIQDREENANAYLVDSYTALATTYLRTEDLDSAALLIEEAVKLGERFYGQNSGELEYPLAIASRIAKKQNNYPEALRYAERALQINKKIFGENHFFTAQRLNTVGLVHRDFGQAEKAGKYFLESLKIKEEYFPAEIKSIYISKYNYAVTLLSRYRTQEAIKILEEVREADAEIYPEGHVYTAYTFLQLGRAYLDAGLTDKAGKSLEQARTIIEAQLDSMHSRRGDVYRLLSQYHMQNNETGKALSCVQKARDIYLTIYESNHWKCEYTGALLILAGKTGSQSAQKEFMRQLEKLASHPWTDPYYKSQLIRYAEKAGFKI